MLYCFSVLIVNLLKFLSVKMDRYSTEKKQYCVNREDDNIQLPGFRFHPTDEELVGFYLQRKLEKKLLKVDIIKQVDIYKYDPSDLSKMSTVGVENKEWFFFCLQGRKYPNSARPNRVTDSGFWKATGIDKKIYFTSTKSQDNCIGLKKSLVYYRGSAGKGTITDWTMHEFRLPPNKHVGNLRFDGAENLTICRIFKRNKTVCGSTKTSTAPKKSPGSEAVKATSPVYEYDTDIGCEDWTDSSSSVATLAFQQQRSNQDRQQLRVNQNSRFQPEQQQEQNPNDYRQYWTSGVVYADDIGMENPTCSQSFGFETEYDGSDNIDWDEIGRYLDQCCDKEPSF